MVRVNLGALDFENYNTSFIVESEDFLMHPKFSYGSKSGFDIGLIKTPTIPFSGKNLHQFKNITC